MATTRYGTIESLRGFSTIDYNGPNGPDPRYEGMDDLRNIVKALPVSKTDGEYWFRADVASSANRKTWLSAAKELSTVRRGFGERTIEYGLHWSRSALIGAGELAAALEAWPTISLLQQATAGTECKLSLKRTLGRNMDGSDVLGIFGNSMTSFGKENLDKIAPFVDAQVNQMQTSGGIDLIGRWLRRNDHLPILFGGFPSHICTDLFQNWTVDWTVNAVSEAKTLLREAENTFREESGIPRIGEGWVAETAFFYAIKAAFPDHSVEQHARPKWLGRQHLDVFIPSLSVALEYQGLQHDEPVEFFGGVEAFEANQARDARKLRLASRHGVRIIYVRAGYSLDEITRQINPAV
jgi:hypothetical protein